MRKNLTIVCALPKMFLHSDLFIVSRLEHRCLVLSRCHGRYYPDTTNEWRGPAEARLCRKSQADI